MINIECHLCGTDFTNHPAALKPHLMMHREDYIERIMLAVEACEHVKSVHYVRLIREANKLLENNA